MRVLKIEGAGCVPRGDVENCRLRTTFENDHGDMIYLEVHGVNAHQRSPSHVGEFHGYVSHCFYLRDANRSYSELLAHVEKMDFEYSKQGILNLINKHLKCSFDTIEIINEGYDGFKDQDQNVVRKPKTFLSRLEEV